MQLYLTGAALAVAFSFIIRALIPDRPEAREPKRIAGPGVARVLSAVLRVAAIALFAIGLVTAAFVEDGGLTLPLLLFWVVFIVGGVTCSALLDGLWERADPWASIDRWTRVEAESVGALPPPWLGPLSLYLLFWFELVGPGFEPRGVLFLLLAYSIYSFTFRPRFGESWPLADPFSILFGFAGRIAPFVLRDDGIFKRSSISSIDDRDPMPKALFGAVFILLGSTTLDNVSETTGWFDLLRALNLDGLSPNVAKVIDSVALALFALLFAALFFATTWLARRWIGRDRTLGELGRSFGWSLIPIGVAYVLAHNAPLLMIGLPRLLVELSDPFGTGLNLLGTTHLFSGYSPAPSLVWFIEIALIVGGHVMGVLVAHREAVRLAPSRGAAVRSQLALTGLMSLFTISTLWLLSQPLVV